MRDSAVSSSLSLYLLRSLPGSEAEIPLTPQKLQRHRGPGGPQRRDAARPKNQEPESSPTITAAAPKRRKTRGGGASNPAPIAAHAQNRQGEQGEAGGRK